MAHVGENIKRIRTEKRLTITDVSNEHVSRGMISLIENGKTQPSIERLQHIASQLGVDISELVEEFSRADMQKLVSHVLELLEHPTSSTALKAKQMLEPIVLKNPIGYEGARMYELYSKCLYFLYVNDEKKTVGQNSWIPFIQSAIQMYEDMQMEWRAIRCWGFLADIQFDCANYYEVVRIIDRATKQLTIGDSYETKSVYIEMMSTKSMALESMGMHKEALDQLDNTILFARQHIVLKNYYSLLNARAWLYYGEQKFTEARECIVEAELFVRLLKQEGLELEFQLTGIFLQEFFEKNYSKALKEATDLIDKLRISTILSSEEILAVQSMAMNLKARVLTKLERHEEALTLFRAHPIILNDRVKLSPIDLAIRVLSNSYEAVCLHQLGYKTEAEELARDAIKQLQIIPHSSFYHFARNVLDDIQ